MGTPNPQPTLERWQKAIGKTPTLVPGNRVDYLIDGWAAFEAIEQAIESTLVDNDGSYYIYLAGWYCDLELPLKAQGKTLDQLFYAASMTFNVQVRIILWDAIFTADVREQPGLDQRSINTGAVARVNDLPTGAGILDNNTRWHYVGAHHQKLLVVKGSQGLIGLCGGIDVNADRIKADKKTGAPLHDVHCRISGAGALGLLKVFVDRWLATPEHVAIDRQPDDYTRLYRQIQQTYGTSRPFMPSDQKGPLLGLKDVLAPATGKAAGNQYVAIARTFNFVTSGDPCAQEHSIKTSMIGSPQQGTLGLIATAMKYIYVEDQYLWNLDAARAIGLALGHLQYVIILISHTDQVESIPNPDGGVWAHYNFMKVIADICREKGYDVRKVKTFHRVVKGTKDLGPNTYVHAKCWIFDDEVAVIGSANCNRRGWEADSEVAAIIYDAPDPGSQTSFANSLRCALWQEHLGIAAKELNNWLGANKKWPQNNEDPKKECSVVYYDMTAKPPLHPTDVVWDKVDPGDKNLPPCGNRSIVIGGD